MTENRHPIEDAAYDYAQAPRFCEFADWYAPTASGWPHSRGSAERFICMQCGIQSLGELGTNGQSAKRFWDLVAEYRTWDAQQVLDV